MRTTVLFLLASTALPGSVMAGPAVYPGRSIPPETYPHVWRIDPVHGDDLKGTGSATAPWKSLASLFAPGPWGAPRFPYPY